MTIYSTTDKENIGIFESPYYWWESGSVWTAFIDYWFLTGDDQYNEQVAAHINSQMGPNGDFMPPNQTKTEVSSGLPQRHPIEILTIDPRATTTKPSGASPP